jgi:membrane protein required for colicin V production
MNDVSVTAVDVVVVAVLLISGGFAMWRGLVSETFTIIDWVAAAFVAIRFTPTFQPLLRGMIAPSWLEYAVVFIGPLLLMFIPLSILNHRLSAAVRLSEIGPVDRVLGAVFGLARGLVIVGLAYIAFTAMVPAKDHPEALTQAKLYPLIRQTSEVLLDLVPGQRGVAGLETAPAKTPPEPAPDAAAAPQRADAAEPDTKTYGANDRRALDRLIETTGGQGGSSR